MEKVRENMEKTGNTPFEFEKLTIAMRDAIFLPMKSLNQLRRDALEGLEKLCVEQFRREVEQVDRAGIKAQESKTGTPEKYLSALTEQRCQLQPLLESELVSDIYLDQGCYRRKDLWEEVKEDAAKIHAAGKKAYYVFPSVFRKNASDFYLGSLKKLNGCSVDGVVVKSLDAVWFVHRYLPQMPMILDQGLYTYNHRAQEILREFCPIRMTAPYELRSNVDVFLSGLLSAFDGFFQAFVSLD